jgi:hypothetical protein
MMVDSFRFLPRSFRQAYEMAPTADPPVWTPFARRLAEASIALLTSAGAYVDGIQQPFDLDRERREPTWGDPTYRLIPRSATGLAMAHLHVNDEDFRRDPEVALPLRRLDELVADGAVGSSVDEHVSVMGYQGDLAAWREETGPAIVAHLHAQSADGIVLAPV